MRSVDSLMPKVPMLHFFAVSISFWKDISVLPTVDTFPKSFCFLAIWVQKLCQSCQLNWEQLLGNSLISLILKSYPMTKMPLIFSLSLFFLLFFARTLITIKKRLGDSGSLVLPLFWFCISCLPNCCSWYIFLYYCL